MPRVADDAVRFAEQLLSLVDTGRTSSTYKLATLLALIDVAVESTDPVDGAPTRVRAKRVAERVVELYWPQSAVYGAVPGGALVQSPQAGVIPARLADWRQRHGIGSRATLDDARRVDPAGWTDLEHDLVARVLQMPIPRLQRFGDGARAAERRFIFDYAWHDKESPGRLMAVEFDDWLHLKPGVGEHLVRLAPLLRPVIHSKWIDLVVAYNAGLHDVRQLDEFLFGAQRVNLDVLREPLTDLQMGRCFYCDLPMRRAVHVDHFIPWSRNPDNRLDNLVAADDRCNTSKSTSLASHPHLASWVERTTGSGLDDLASATGWQRDAAASAHTAAASYRWMPAGARLWSSVDDYEELDPDRIGSLLALLRPSP